MKKLALIATLSLAAFFSACSDDSSSPNSSNSNLPTSVKTFFDLADIECNAARKCEKILVEEGNDYYQCDGVQQWNMIMEAFPSKVCPVDSDKPADGDKENSEDKEQPSNGNQNEQTNDNTSDTGNTGNNGTDSEQAGDNSANNEGKSLVSCLLEVSMSMSFGGEAMEFTTTSCTEVAEGDDYVKTLNEKCIDIPTVEAEGFSTTQKASKGSSCPTNYKVKCTGSAGNTVYLYDEDSTEEDCEDVK